MLKPLQEHVPAFVLAVAPVYKGQDHAFVRHWINQVTLWGEAIEEAIEEDGQTHALVNLAVEASLSSHNQAEMKSDDEDNEDDNPKHCALYSSNGCKCRELSFKCPHKTLWMECSFPSCHNWYHEVCLSLKFKTEE